MFAKKMLLLYPIALMAGSMYKGQDVHAASAGLFAAPQAARGATVYSAQCASCHGSDLGGIGQNPPLAGEEFLSKYQGESVVALYDTIHTSMPATNPGSLTRPQTADVLAYILSSNKYLAGTTELPSDDESLKKIQLDKPGK